MFKDARHSQIIVLSLFLLFGIVMQDWTLHPQQIIAVIFSCLCSQFIAVTWVCCNLQPTSQTRQTLVSSWKSALITALGLCLLLRTNHPGTMALAGSFAIFSKFLFCYQGKHFFNPANFGIIMVLILTQDAWVSPGQWGTETWYFLLFAATGGLILKQVGRWETSAVFLSVYASLVALQNLWLGWSLDVYWHQLSSGSLLLFACFMLTDPRSIPNARFARILWSVCIAVLTFILQSQFYLPTAAFWVLFCISPLTLILDRFWSKSPFEWRNSQTLFRLSFWQIS